MARTKQMKASQIQEKVTTRPSYSMYPRPVPTCVTCSTVKRRTCGRQIVDMALRALSPSINDTTTAVMCVDYLTAILARLAFRNIPSSRRYEEGDLSVITLGPTFEDLLAEWFDQIRGSAKGNIAIMLGMLGALQTISGRAARPSRQRALRDQVRWIAELAELTLESAHDRTRIDPRLARVREALETDPVLGAGEEKD